MAQGSDSVQSGGGVPPPELSPEKKETESVMGDRDVKRVSTQEASISESRDIANIAHVWQEVLPGNVLPVLEKTQGHRIQQEVKRTSTEARVNETESSLLSRDEISEGREIQSKMVTSVPLEPRSQDARRQLRERVESQIQPKYAIVGSSLKRGAEVDEPKGRAILATIEVATSRFLMQRIGEGVLAAAHEVVGSLNHDIIHTAPVDRAETAALEQSFLSTLPPLGTFRTEQDLLETVVRDKIGIADYKLKELSGGSGARVYGVFVPKEGGKLAYVIKTMEGKTSELARELTSLQQLSDMTLHHSVLSTPQFAGKYALEAKGTVQTVFVQTAARGKPFSSLFEEVGKLQGPERLEKLQVLREGLLQAARGLAELHLKNRQLAAPVGEETQELNLSYLKELYDDAKDILKRGKTFPVSEGQLDTIYQQVTKAVVGNWGMSGYSHGDTHLDNLYLDASIPQFSLIDTPSFCCSIGEEQQPIGFPAYDFAWTWGNIIERGFLSGLTLDEVRILRVSFREEYERIMGENLAPVPAQNLAVLTKQLLFLLNASGYQRHLAEQGKIAEKQEDFDRASRLIASVVADLSK